METCGGTSARDSVWTDQHGTCAEDMKRSVGAGSNPATALHGWGLLTASLRTNSYSCITHTDLVGYVRALGLTVTFTWNAGHIPATPRPKGHVSDEAGQEIAWYMLSRVTAFAAEEHGVRTHLLVLAGLIQPATVGSSWLLFCPVHIVVVSTRAWLLL